MRTDRFLRQERGEIAVDLVYGDVVPIGAPPHIEGAEVRLPPRHRRCGETSEMKSDNAASACRPT